MILNLDHIALLTSNLSSVASCLPSWIYLDEQEQQPSEGTLEQYAHLPRDDDPSLLFLEPIADGPYRRALAKRGPGLHHLGFSTNTIDAAIDYFASNGLLLHPISRYTYKHNAAWMCRPGIPFLVEIYVPPEIRQVEQRVIKLSIPYSADTGLPRIDWIPAMDIIPSMDTRVIVHIGDQHLTIMLDAEQGAQPDAFGAG